MFETLKTISIQGGYFEQLTTLELFSGKQPLNIIYGRNGSGKSSIAKAIRQLVGKDNESQSEVGYISYSVITNPAIDEEKLDSVYVFDEEFIRENVRTKGTGLETIVMLGNQVEIDTQITQKNEEKSSIINQIKEFNNQKEIYQNKKNNSSPSFIYNKIKDRLREDNGWAEIDRTIKGNTIKSQVTEDLVKRLASMSEPRESDEDLRRQLNLDLALYTQTADAKEILWNAPDLHFPENLDFLKSILKKKIEQPILSEREQRLLTFLQIHAEHHLQETTKKLTEEKWQFCPLCLRENNTTDFENISETLKRILNKESEIYDKELDGILLSLVDIVIVVPELPQLNETEKITFQLAGEQINKDLAAIREIIKQRKRNIYGMMVDVFPEGFESDYIQHVKNFITATKRLEECILSFNRSVNERTLLKKKLIYENDSLAKKLLVSLFDSYLHSKKMYDDCIKTLSVLEGKKKKIELEIKELKAQSESTDIALNYINDELQFVFFSDTKARLIAGDGCYKLKINGKDVPPKKISVGERNVLGLCYFFARLFSNKKNDKKYHDEVLILIDDPVSSFDDGNRLGVMSLLRHQFANIKKGNLNSRMIVLTHDLRSAFDLVKIRSELNNGGNGEKKFSELVNKSIVERQVSNEYKKLLECVYEYAQNGESEITEYIETGIGNIMRRAIEAFSSFCYNMKFEKMMCDERILKLLPENKRSYYENFMCRLALNGESHMEEPVYDLNTITPYFSTHEKIQTAKSLLLFLCHINEEHLSCYLSSKNGGEDKVSVIKSWEKEELSWM